MKPIPPTEFPLPRGATEFPLPRGATDFSPALDRSPEPAFDVCAMQWLALHRAAAAVATLAGLPGEALDDLILGFPAAIAQAGGWREGLARQSVADLAAVMEPGLTALIAVHARGCDPAPAARALLQEFTTARDAVLALARHS